MSPRGDAVPDTESRISDGDQPVSVRQTTPDELNHVAGPAGRVPQTQHSSVCTQTLDRTYTDRDCEAVAGAIVKKAEDTIVQLVNQMRGLQFRTTMERKIKEDEVRFSEMEGHSNSSEPGDVPFPRQTQQHVLRPWRNAAIGLPDRSS